MVESLKIKKLFIALSTAFLLSISQAQMALAQGAPTAAPAPTAPPAPTYDEPAPTAPPAPTYEGSTTSEGDSSSPEGQSSSGEEYNGEYSGTEAINSGNGTESDNTANAENNQETTVEATNTGTVENTINVEGSTGENDASRNTGGVSSINTGDSNVGVTVETNLNTTTVSGSACCGGGVTAVNSGNGSNSQNSATASQSSTNETTVDNDANINTEIVALSLTGDNDASRNVGESVIFTGDANLSATVITDANTTSMGIYNFDVSGNQTGDIVLGENSANCVNCTSADSVQAVNSGNGTNSTSEATAESTTTNEETITNDAEVINDIYLTANSGDNDASRNTGGDSTIVTGDANVAANVVNTVNTVLTGSIYTVNIFGNLVGDILLPQDNSSSSCSDCCNSNVSASNVDNGADSQNTANASSTNTSTTTQTNNATINNSLNLDGNTGGNEANFNTAGDSVIETGEVSVSANTLNVANVNVSGSACDEPVYLVWVNNMGQWIGKIVGAPEGSVFWGSDGIAYMVGPGGELIAQNVGNGAGSENTATASSNNTTDITQTNNAQITNNINIEANTGNNSASRNTGGDSSIRTGDANIMVNLVNFVNSNFAGRKVVLTLVNVFGSWIGNFIGPGFSKEQSQGSPTADSSSSGGSSSSSSSGSSSGGGSSSSLSNGQVQNTGSLTLGKVLGKFFKAQTVEEDNAISLPQSNTVPMHELLNPRTFDWRWLLLATPLAVIWILTKGRRFLPIFASRKNSG